MKLVVVRYEAGGETNVTWLVNDGRDIRKQIKEAICEDECIELEDWADYELKINNYYFVDKLEQGSKTYEVIIKEINEKS